MSLPINRSVDHPSGGGRLTMEAMSPSRREATFLGHADQEHAVWIRPGNEGVSLGHFRDHVYPAHGGLRNDESRRRLLRVDPGFSEDRLLAVHMSLGATVLVLAVLRLLWRVLTPLPAWATTLTPFERKYEHRVEHVLYVLILAIPLSGMLAAMADGKDLVFFGIVEVPPLISENSDLDDLTLGFHIASHLAFFAALALHVGLVVKHQVINRDRLLNRML